MKVRQTARRLVQSRRACWKMDRIDSGRLSASVMGVRNAIQATSLRHQARPQRQGCWPAVSRV